MSDNWDNNIKTLIQHLAVANAGKSLGVTAKEYVINALSSLNQMLPDELLNQLINQDIDEARYDFISNHWIKKTIGDDTYSISKPGKRFVIKMNNTDYTSFKNLNGLNDDVDEELCKELYLKYMNLLGQSNFKLLCEKSFSTEIRKSGNIYISDNSELLDYICKDILKSGSQINTDNFTLIKLDISSSCDYAQNKLKRIRVLPGIIIDDSHFASIDNTEDIYCTPELTVDSNLVKIAFNFHYITSESKENLNEIDRIFSFRDLLLTEIKHKLSSFVSRVGIINL